MKNSQDFREGGEIRYAESLVYLFKISNLEMLNLVAKTSMAKQGKAGFLKSS